MRPQPEFFCFGTAPAYPSHALCRDTWGTLIASLNCCKLLRHPVTPGSKARDPGAVVQRSLARAGGAAGRLSVLGVPREVVGIIDRMISRTLKVAWIAACLVLLACSPALDWREVRPPGTRLQALFPCKPTAQERKVRLAGQTVTLSLHACAAAGWTWGLAHADVVDPTLLGAALNELRSTAAANIGAPAAEPLPAQVPGATPHPASARMHLVGRRPDGQALQMQMAVFAHGTRVFQATVLGERASGEEATSFFGGLRFLP